MSLPLLPYLLILFLTAAVCGVIIVVAWQYRARHTGAVPLALAWWCAFVWSLGYGLQLGSPQLTGQLFWFYFTHFGIIFFPIGTLLVIWPYVGREQVINWRRLTPLLVLQTGLLLFVWSNPLHELFMSNLHLEQSPAGFPILVGEREIGFWVIYGFGYLIVSLAVASAVQSLLTTAAVYRAQVGALLLGSVPVLVGNIFFLLEIAPFPDFNLTPFMFLSMAISFALAFLRFRLLDLAPLSNETIISNISDGVIVLDEQDRVVNFNTAAQRITQPYKLAIGEAINIYIPHWAALFAKAITAIDRPQEVALDKDETRHYYETHISPLYDQRHGTLIGRLVVLHDITERKRVEEANALQNEYMKALHETSLGLMRRLNLSELLADLLERASQLLEAPHSYIYIGQPHSERLKLEVGRGYFAAAVGQTISSSQGLAGKVWQTGYPLLVADYDSWPNQVAEVEPGILGTIMAMPLNSGTDTVGVIGLARSKDAAERFGNEELEFLSRFARLGSIILDNANLYMETQAARATAEAANEAKSDFLANVSHELRTPLTSILGFAKLIQSRLEERILPQIQSDDRKVQRAIEQVRTNFDIILKEGERLAALINDVLDLEKIEAGKMEWHLQPLAISEVVERVLSATFPLFEQKGLEQKSFIAEDLPLIEGDRDQLHQVMVNLISNAVKFTDQGSVTCRASCTDGMITVSVADTGIGIAAEDLPRVFDKFTQLGNTLTDKPRGTGLGLPICRYIVEKHGGEIWLESQERVGTTFYFTLPILHTVA